jgi:hypothetical protein
VADFTAAELANITNAHLDFYLKGMAEKQSIQERPTMSAFRRAQKTFPGGRGDIKGNVKGDYTTTFMGFSGSDTVTFSNPANLKQFTWAWYELHAGISITHSELKRDGISVADSAIGEKTVQHSERAQTAITNLLEDKLDDMREGSERSFNLILWRDGSQSAKVYPGIQAIIRDAPTTGIVGGIDAATNSWWRNRSLVGASKIVSSTSSQTLTKTLRSEVRQLRRYGGRPTLWIAGSTAIQKMEDEIHEKGTYTQEGFMKSGATELGMPAVSMKGVGQCMYDPTLDDLGKADYMYFIDPRHIHLRVMDGEDMKPHAPARPPEKYVLYRSVTWTGVLMANKLNCHGVYQVS